MKVGDLIEIRFKNHSELLKHFYTPVLKSILSEDGIEPDGPKPTGVGVITKLIDSSEVGDLAEVMIGGGFHIFPSHICKVISKGNIK